VIERLCRVPDSLCRRIAGIADLGRASLVKSASHVLGPDVIVVRRTGHRTRGFARRGPAPEECSSRVVTTAMPS
jgi:hypothetical protein